MAGATAEMDFSPDDEESRPEFVNIFSDRDLRIQYRGQASREQREQVSLAARLIKRILRSRLTEKGICPVPFCDGSPFMGHRRGYG